MLIKTQALTLKTTPFKDSSQIIQLFAKDLGVISAILNQTNSKNRNFISVCSTFSVNEVIFKKKKSDIYTIKEVNIYNCNLHLRKDLHILKNASKMVSIILKNSLHFTKPNEIYFLLKSYLNNLYINPDGLFSSFLLKLLSHEKFLHLQMQCNKCSNIPSYIENGESLCKEHCLKKEAFFSQEEFELLLILCFTKSFSLIKDLQVSEILKNKISMIFEELV